MALDGRLMQKAKKDFRKKFRPKINALGYGLSFEIIKVDGDPAIAANVELKTPITEIIKGQVEGILPERHTYRGHEIRVKIVYKDSFIPAHYLPPHPLEKLILTEEPIIDSDNSLDVDVAIVGAGPAGLSAAYWLAKLIEQDNEGGGNLGDVSIAVFEKAAALGYHSLSGAIVDPRVFFDLFPNLSVDQLPFRQAVPKEGMYWLTEAGHWKVPVPPTMRNGKFHIASLCEIVRWMGEQVEALGVDILPGFPVESLQMDQGRVLGFQTTPRGLDREGRKLDNYSPGTTIRAKVTVLTDGTSGTLSQAYLNWMDITPGVQTSALAVKEVWRTKEPLTEVIHTVGYPLPNDTFGGSFMYPLEDHLVALGLVAGLDSPNAGLDVQGLLQKMKQHPFFKHRLQGGELIEAGAKTIPEGGLYGMPERLSGDGVVLGGDCVSMVNVPALKGIDYAMQAGVLAAQAIYGALKANDTSAVQLSEYDRLVRESFIYSDLWKVRNMRMAFMDSNLYLGGVKTALYTLTNGRFQPRNVDPQRDAWVRKHAGAQEAVVGGIGRDEFVYRSGTATNENQPSHLISQDVPTSVAEMLKSMCPAGVYQIINDKLRVVPSSCIHCKSTSAIGFPFTTPLGGGPQYTLM